VSRAETFGIAHVVWFVSAIYLVAGPELAWCMAIAGFGLVAAGFRYSTLRERLRDLIGRRR